MQIIDVPSAPWRLVFSPDGGLLLSNLGVWEMPTGAAFPQPGRVGHGFTPEGALVFGNIAPHDAGIALQPALYPARGGPAVWEAPPPPGLAWDGGCYLNTMALSPRAGLLAGGSPHQGLLYWSWPSLEPLSGWGDVHQHFDLTPDGRGLVALTAGALTLIDLATRRPLWRSGRMKLAPGRYVGPRVSPDGRWAAFASGKHLWTLDASTGEAVATLSRPRRSVQDFAFTADGRFLACVSDEDVLPIYARPRGPSAARWPGALAGSRPSHSPPTGCSGPPAARGRRSSCGTSTGEGAIMRVLKNPDGPTYDLELGGDGRWLMTRRSAVRVAALPGGELKPLPLDGDVRGAALAGGALLALTDDALVVIDLATEGHLRSAPLGGSLRARCLAFSEKGGVIAAVGGVLRSVLLWSWPGLEARPPFRPARVAARLSYPETCLSPDGRWLALRYQDQWVEVYDVASGERAWEGRPPGLEGWSYFAFSPDGRRLALGSGRHLTLMDVADGRTLASAQLEKKYYRGLAFTPDGRFLAAVSHEETVKAYDATSLTLRHEMAWEVGKLERVAFSADGILGAASGGKKVVVWDVDW